MPTIGGEVIRGKSFTGVSHGAVMKHKEFPPDYPWFSVEGNIIAARPPRLDVSTHLPLLCRCGCEWNGVTDVAFGVGGSST